MSNDLWYALKVRSRCEGMVAEILSAKGYELFLPTYKSRRRWSDRVKTLELPLFPGYLFCQFDLKTRLPILTTPGVSFIVGSGRLPEPVDRTEIEDLRTVVRAGVAYSPHPYVNVGQKVRIEYGALTGLVGLVTEVRNEMRLILSVNLLMRSVSIEVDRTWVQPIQVQEKFLPVTSGKSMAARR
jgi:transcription antitermination factor NusG